MTEQNWHDRMVEHLTLRGRSENTIRTYLAAVKNFFKYYGEDRRPESITHEEYRAYFMHLITERKYSNAAVKSHLHGTRVLFKDILGHDWFAFDLLKEIPEKHSIPTVLTRSEVGMILRNFKDLRYRSFFMIVYSCGLRRSEAVKLKVTDIDSERMRVIIRDAKGNKDREVPLTMSALKLLRKYYRLHRNPVWIFPSYGRGRGVKRSLEKASTATKPVSAYSIQQALRANVRDLKFHKQKVTTHTFRHSYATHLLEEGVDIRNVQLFLGHADIKTTVRYLHMTSVGLKKAIAIINRLMGGKK